MANFQYSGTLKSGEKTSGSIEASDRKTALLKLRRKGVVPLKVSETNELIAPEKQRKKTNFTSPHDRPADVKANDLLGLNLAKRLYDLHSGGMSLGDSINLLSQRMTEKRMKGICVELWRQLREGRTFAKAVESMPRLFPPAMYPLFEAAEASGDTEAILKNVIEYMEERRELKKKILASLSYPAVLITLVLLIMIGFLFFLLPRIQTMIDSMGGEMNIFTRILIGFSEGMISVGPIALIVGVVMFFLLIRWRKTTSGRLISDRWFLKIPLIGPILRTSNLYQLSNLMATLMESGINTTENLKLSEKTIQNYWLRESFEEARTMIIEGASFSSAFRQHELFPDQAIDVLTVGENTGNLEKGLSQIAISVKTLLDRHIKTLTVVVSSGAMGFAFLMVLFAALGMVLSVLEVSETISFQ